MVFKKTVCLENIQQLADVMELEYIQRSERCARNGLWVRIPPSAQVETNYSLLKTNYSNYAANTTI